MQLFKTKKARKTVFFMDKKHTRNFISDSGGFTLVEVLVAITILLLVIMPLASFYATSLGTIQRSMLYSQALQLCRERIEFCQSIGYDELEYANPVYTPGFTFDEGQFNQNRDPDITDNIDIITYDPLDINDDGYPVPVYRDYYDNSTGLLIDPNFNGMCDDDLDGDGLFGVIDGDSDDLAIANPNKDLWTDYIPLNNLPQWMQDFANKNSSGGINPLQKAGDGYYDTVVEGIYANAFDPYLFGTRQLIKGTNSREEVAPIVDFSLQVDPKQLAGFTVGDYRHREQTFRTFARMTTIIDPTPVIKDPNVQDPDVYHYADGLYPIRRMIDDSWTSGQRDKFLFCTQRDVPLSYNIDNLSVGVDRQGFDDPEDYTMSVTNPFKQNYSRPIYGKKVIVTVFFLSGEGEQEDVNEDGFPDGETFATSANLSMQRVFYNDNLLGGSISGVQPPVARFDTTFYDDYGHLIPVIIGDAEETDPCSFENLGLPYLDDDWPGNV